MIAAAFAALKAGAGAVFGAIPWQALVALVAAVGLAGGIWATADHWYALGRKDAQAAAEVAAAREQARQQAANTRAQALAARRAAELERQNADLQQTLTEITDAMRDHPGRDDCGLDAFGLQLLERIGADPETGSHGSAADPHP